MQRQPVTAFAATGLLGLAIDQATKFLAVARLDPEDPPELLGGLLTLQLIRNPGAAFSMGSGATVLITCLAIVATLVMLLYVAPRLTRTRDAVLAGFALAGITGNLADRLFRGPGPFRGHVVDFFQLPHFAIFNVADIFLTCTAVVVVALSLFQRPVESQEQP